MCTHIAGWLAGCSLEAGWLAVWLLTDELAGWLERLAGQLA